MITFDGVGRLGNFLFQCAASMSLAMDNDQEFHVPQESLNALLWPVYLQHLNNKEYNPNLERITIEEKQHNYEALVFDPNWKDKNVALRGFFQSEKYFKHNWTKIRKAWALDTFKLDEPVVSIHVRRGDYLQYPKKHPVVTMEYITKALEFFKEKGFKKFLIFSDDREWCHQNINSAVFPGLRFQMSMPATELADICVMASCHHHIIANSSYSWWGAYLNSRQDKIVVAPHEDNWYGPDNKHLDTKDLLPKEWIRIKY